MKRFALVALVAAMVFSLATSVSATELKVRGSFDVYGEWSSNLKDFNSDETDMDNQLINQRVRAYFDYVANENLKAVLGLEIDNIWGDGAAADWGTDGKGNIEVKHAYLDFTFPDTAVNVQAGLQYVALPSVFGSPIFDDDAAAITISAPINDMFAVTLGFTRGEDNSYTGSTEALNDETDGVMIITPITLDGLTIAPYFTYAWVGKDTDNWSANPNSLIDPDLLKDFGIGDITGDATAWWLGANVELTMFDPFVLKGDLIYGSLDGEVEGLDVDQSGWVATLAASYKMEMVTPTVFMIYGTGIDKDDVDLDNLLTIDDIELSAMPALSEGFSLTPFMGGGRAFGPANDEFLVGNAPGIWAMGVKLDNIQFVENLTHNLTFAYAQGTSDEYDDTLVKFDDKSSAWEIYMVNKYQIYENLAAINEISYFKADIDADEDFLGDDIDMDDAAYFVSFGFQYKF